MHHRNDKRDQRHFFDQHAAQWDEHLQARDHQNINKILRRAQVGHDDVLDVGAGTGILVNPLFSLGIKNYTAIDFSIGMQKIFERKFPHLKYLVGDFHEVHFSPQSFDKVIIFNTFPHFERPAIVVQQAYSYLRPGGRLVIAHSLNRKELNACHRRAGKEVARDILPTMEQFLVLYSMAGFRPLIDDAIDYFYSHGDKA
jgi:ubiquinone/menaquinone biosynthesis C-methylase UbiE